MSNYQPGIPTGTVNLDVDYQNLQDNFQQLDTTFGINHLPFSNQTAQNGYHTNINMVPFSTTVTDPPNNQPVNAPGATNGFGQIFNAQINDGYDADEVLYFLSGGGKLAQLTRNFKPVIDTVNSSGSTYLPGGLIFQWGKVTFGVPTSGTVTFSAANKPFPNNCFAVFTQPFTNGSPSSGITVSVKLNTNVSFDWKYYTTSSSYPGFFWTAIGY